MNKFVYSLAVGLTAATLLGGSASAAIIQPLDQYGCRWEGATNNYVCYRGPYAGRHFINQAEMMRYERVVPVYVDDDGAPRPIAPMTARGKERPPTDAGLWEEWLAI